MTAVQSGRKTLKESEAREKHHASVIVKRLRLKGNVKILSLVLSKEITPPSATL
jgi:hypothetical protein